MEVEKPLGLPSCYLADGEIMNLILHALAYLVHGRTYPRCIRAPFFFFQHTQPEWWVRGSRIMWEWIRKRRSFKFIKMLLGESRDGKRKWEMAPDSKSTLHVNHGSQASCWFEIHVTELGWGKTCDKLILHYANANRLKVHLPLLSLSPIQ